MKIHDQCNNAVKQHNNMQTRVHLYWDTINYLFNKIVLRKITNLQDLIGLLYHIWQIALY